jgi:hypothetical protein
LTREASVPKPLYVQHDLGSDLFRLGDESQRPKRCSGRLTAIELARLDPGRN